MTAKSDKPFSPDRWANTLAGILNQAFGPDHFPIDVVSVARDYSAQRFPNDSVTLIAGANLPGFDGALIRAPEGKSGWGIIYNDAIASKGRVNFTLAHEFGHYLIHRLAHPDGLRCRQQDVVRWDSEYRQIEQQANKFAAGLLMPLDDFRRQIGARAKIDFDMISHCADRYRVSMIAAILRWLEYTERRAVLVVSCDGFIKWARSSTPAMKTGTFFRTSQNTIEISRLSPASGQVSVGNERASIKQPPGVWFPEEVQEITIFAEQYDFFISLLLLEDRDRWEVLDEEPELDVVDRIAMRQMQ